MVAAGDTFEVLPRGFDFDGDLMEENVQSSNSLTQILSDVNVCGELLTYPYTTHMFWAQT